MKRRSAGNSISHTCLLLAGALLVMSACKPPQKVAVGEDATGDAEITVSMGSDWVLPSSQATVDGEPLGSKVATPVPKPPPPPPPRSDAALLQRFKAAVMAEILAELKQADGGDSATLDELTWETPPASPRSKKPTAADVAGSESSAETHAETEPDLLAGVASGLGADLAGAPKAVADFDGDGFPDVVVATAKRIRLFRHDVEAGRFTEYEDPGLDGIEGGSACTAADFDADGQVDVLVLRGDGRPSSLLRNLGDGRFADVTVERGLLDFRDTQAAVWADFDADGALDLLLANGGKGQRFGLYRGDGKGGFKDCAHQWRLRKTGEGVRDAGLIDVDSDAWLDVAIAGEGKAAGWYRNAQGSGFEKMRTIDPALRGPLRVADLDDDGREDLLACDGKRWRWWRNAGDSSFEDVSEFAGLDQLEICAVGSTASPSLVVADFDGDGDQDLLGGNPLRLALNRRGDRFVESSVPLVDMGTEASAVLGLADFDADGDLDVLAGHWMLSSQAAGAAEWTRLVLTPDLAGAEVILSVRDEGWIRSDIHRRIGPGDAASLVMAAGEAEVIVDLKLRLPGGDSVTAPRGGKSLPLRGDVRLSR